MQRFCSSSWRGWRSPPRRRRAAGLASSPQDAQGASPSESRRPESWLVVLSSQRSWLLVELERPPPPASQILWDEWSSLKKGCNNALKYNFLLTCAGSTPQTLRLKVCLHLNQPGWERTLLVVAADDTDWSLGKIRRYDKDGLVSKSPKQTGSRAKSGVTHCWVAHGRSIQSIQSLS